MRVRLREFDERGHQLNRHGIRRSEGPFELTIDHDSLNLRADFTDWRVGLSPKAIVVLSVGVPLIVIILIVGVDWSYYWDANGPNWGSMKIYLILLANLIGGFVISWLLNPRISEHDPIKPYREIPLMEIQDCSVVRRTLIVHAKVLNTHNRFLLIHRSPSEALESCDKLNAALAAD